MNAPLEWTREKDGTDNQGRPMYDYRARWGSVRFHITKSTDAGFGISIYDDKADNYVGYHGIAWLGTLGRCKDKAERVLNDELRTIGLHGPVYIKQALLNEAIDELRRMQARVAVGDKIGALEKIAYELLKSAGKLGALE